MNDENEMNKDRLAQLVKVFDTEVAQHPAIPDCMTPSEFVNL